MCYSPLWCCRRVVFQWSETALPAPRIISRETRVRHQRFMHSKQCRYLHARFLFFRVPICPTSTYKVRHLRAYPSHWLRVEHVASKWKWKAHVKASIIQVRLPRRRNRKHYKLMQTLSATRKGNKFSEAGQQQALGFLPRQTLKMCFDCNLFTYQPIIAQIMKVLAQILHSILKWGSHGDSSKLSSSKLPLVTPSARRF